MLALLPMYDWPEHRDTTDEFWRLIRNALVKMDVEAPQNLDRESDLYTGWLRPDLLLSQTCGLPLVRGLRGKVSIIGAVDHGLPDLPAGTYRSRIILRKSDPATCMADLRGRTATYNSADSQSGAGSLRHMVLPHAVGGRFFGEAHPSQSHANSIRAVAEGRADVAAIDAVSWELALRHMPETADLRVLVSTPPTPGLPLITAKSGPVVVLYAAIAQALVDLDPDQRSTLMMQRLLPRSDADFDIIARWDAEAQAAGYEELNGGSA